MTKKDLKAYITRVQKQRDLLEKSLLTFCDARKGIDEFELSDIVDDMKYFNKKVIKGIIQYISDVVITSDMAKFGITAEKIRKEK